MLCRPERPDRRECCYQRPQSGQEHEDAGCSNNRRLIGNEGEAGGGVGCPGPWKSGWNGRSDVVSVGIAGGRESAGVWVLLFWKEMTFRANPSLRGWGGGGGWNDVLFTWWTAAFTHELSPPEPPSLSPGPSLSSDTKMAQLWPQIHSSSLYHPPSFFPFLLTSSSSLRVSSSMRRMSSMFKSIHLSIQQNSWRWKLVNRRFSCWGLGTKKKMELSFWGSEGWNRKRWVRSNIETFWMKFSTLFCRPHHLNLTVTSLYAHMWGQSFLAWSSFCGCKNTQDGICDATWC